MTLIRRTDFLCPRCNGKCSCRVFKSANVTLDEVLRDEIFNDQLNRTQCEHCGAGIFLPASVLYHDMDKEILVWFHYQPDGTGPLSGTGLPYVDVAPPIRPRGKMVPITLSWDAFKKTILYLEAGGAIQNRPVAGQNDEESSLNSPNMDPDHPRPGDLERWLQQASEGDVDAQFAYAFVHYRGIGVAQNYELARQWFAPAAAQGHVESAFFLGAMLANGWGGIKDSAGAVPLYLKAAEANYMPAQNNLGLMYLNGEGVPQNFAEARFWISVADLNGSDKSEEILKKLEPQMSNADFELASWKLSQWHIKINTLELRPILLTD